ncbi:MAG: UpxY family transcription antiterminator [Bacteroidetes bacterium]|nr:UpxY family transcription antiterminator [Bacteroidota bacterium]
MEELKFNPDDDSWYVLCTRSRFEKKLADQLEKHKIDYYLPTRIERKKWSDRWKNVETVLFPGYLFVQMNESNRYQILNSAGAVRFLYFAGKYATLSRLDVKMINHALDDSQELEVVDSELYEGQEVKITSGPFKGFDAKLVHHNGKGKLLLEVKAIAQGVLIEIGNAKIKPVKKL